MKSGGQHRNSKLRLTIELGGAVVGAILLFRRSDTHAVLCGLYLLLALSIGTAFALGRRRSPNAFLTLASQARWLQV